MGKTRVGWILAAGLMAAGGTGCSSERGDGQSSSDEAASGAVAAASGYAGGARASAPEGTADWGDGVDGGDEVGADASTGAMEDASSGEAGGASSSAGEGAGQPEEAAPEGVSAQPGDDAGTEEGAEPEGAAVPAAEIVASSVDEATGVWSAWLASGARVHHREMETVGGRVMMEVTLADGLLNDGADGVGLSEAAAIALKYPRVGEDRWRDVYTPLQQAGMVPEFTALGDRVRLSLEGPVGALELALSTTARIIRGAEPDEAIIERWKQVRREGGGQAMASPEPVLPNAGLAMLVGSGSEGALTPTDGDFDRMTLEAVGSRVEEIRAAPVELAIVGDVSRDRAIELIEAHFGGLPPRERIGPAHRLRAALAARSEPSRTRTEQWDDRVVVFRAQAIDETLGAMEEVALRMATGVLRRRADALLRGEYQVADRIDVGFVANEPRLARPMLWVRVEGVPGSGGRIARLLGSVTEGLGRAEIAEEVVEAERGRVMPDVARGATDRAAWVRGMSTMTFYGRDLRLLVDGPQRVGSIGSSAVSRAMERTLGEGEWVTVVLEPADPEGPRPARWWVRPTGERGI